MLPALAVPPRDMAARQRSLQAGGDQAHQY